MLQSCLRCLHWSGAAWVVFGHHRPRLVARDMEFFSLARTMGFSVSQLPSVRKPAMFPLDPGDINIRSDVHIYRLAPPNGDSSKSGFP
mmetsp:Transcript_18144/g.37777  ORF Transcript_18144/g.37777 Transcript_18144/m.37777 type:complete len:88 (-) Transcript_18144:16-279(-)